MTRVREITNTHDQLIAAGGGVAIIKSYDPYTNRIDGWRLYRLDANGKELHTGPYTLGYHHGRKWFLADRRRPFHTRQQYAFECAARWVATQGWYGGAWKRNRMGDYVPADVQRRFPLRRPPQ